MSESDETPKRASKKKPAKRPSGELAIRKAIENAAHAIPDVDTTQLSPAHLSKRFIMGESGLQKLGAEQDDPPRWISAPFKIEAETFDEENRRFGLLISWADRYGRAVTEVFPRSLFANDIGELRARLADGGLTMNASKIARQDFAEYLNLCSASKRLACVSRTGWHTVNGARVFVLPDGPIGERSQDIIMQGAQHDNGAFGVGSSLSEWRSNIGEKCIYNSRLAFAASCAFAAPLLRLLGEEGSGIHFRGQSRIGKSTALLVAASVVGGGTAGGASDFIRTWRATSNGLEGIAAQHSDMLLPLDELGQVDAKEVGQIAYMLASGQGKSRSDRSGKARTPPQFLTLFLSTGEIGIGEKAAEGGHRTRAGQELRMLEVAADTGQFGLFEDLHEAESAGAFAEELRAETRRCYGTALREFLKFLTDRMRRDARFLEEMRRRIEERSARWLQSHSGAGGQVRTAARRFSLIAEAGELATSALVTGWSDGEATWAAKKLFETWLEERGTSGSREDFQAVIQMRDFLSRNRTARFEVWQTSQARQVSGVDDGPAEELPPAERFHVMNSAGWRRWWISKPGGPGVWRYFLTVTAMQEALEGLDFRSAIKALVETGYLVTGTDGRNSIFIRPPGAARLRAYEVRATVLGAQEVTDSAEDVATD